MARIVASETEIGGCPVKERDWVLLPFPAANLDPAEFENPDEVMIDRQRNRHLAFGVGIHRCIGSNLARMELRVGLEEWIRRIPDFELAVDDPDAVRWSTGQVRGPRELPLRLLSVNDAQEA
jgi:cytochrome P450